MLTKLGMTISALLISAVWTNEAFAACYAGIGDCGGDSGGAPEIDGPGALSAIAVLLSIGVILYRKVRG